jgi:hypothetical protein
VDVIFIFVIIFVIRSKWRGRRRIVELDSEAHH